MKIRGEKKFKLFFLVLRRTKNDLLTEFNIKQKKTGFFTVISSWKVGGSVCGDSDGFPFFFLDFGEIVCRFC